MMNRCAKFVGVAGAQAVIVFIILLALSSVPACLRAFAPAIPVVAAGPSLKGARSAPWQPLPVFRPAVRDDPAEPLQGAQAALSAHPKFGQSRAPWQLTQPVALTGAWFLAGVAAMASFLRRRRALAATSGVSKPSLPRRRASPLRLD